MRRNEDRNMVSKKWKGLRRSSSGKIVAFILLIITLSMAVFGSIGAWFMWDTGIFTKSQEQFEEEYYDTMTRGEGSNLLWQIREENRDYIEVYCGEWSNLEFQIVDDAFSYETEGVSTKDNLVAYEQTYYLGDYLSDTRVAYMITEATVENIDGIDYYTLECDGIGGLAEFLSDKTFTMEEVEAKSFLNYEITTIVYIDESYPVLDEYYLVDILLDVAYSVEGIIFQLIGFMAVLSCVLFVFLLCCAGYKREYERRVVSGTARIPFGIWFMVAGICEIIAITFAYECLDEFFWGDYIFGLFFYVCAVAAISIFTWMCMDLIVRISTGTLISNLLTVRLWKYMKKLKESGAFWKPFAFAGRVVSKIPLIWKAIVVYVLVSGWAYLMIFFWNLGIRAIMWVIGNAVVLPIFVYCCYMFKKLQLASKALGEGDLSYEVDTKYSVWEFKEMGESLNSVANGMEAAVAQQMKSERMKTELISNVSHDIKTPLTSIVNYADLISKEATDNEKIHEYSQILLRQSDRLKKLTEDLVHASKVTSGNIEVNNAPCDVGVLLAQAIGEYEEKLQQAGLVVVTKKSQESIIINADGRHMWRIFDNLLNNICKYAQEGTRVYLEMEQKNISVMISFKNISKYELNISEEELMERFVRGDQSRHSEGNGLGLSIAKSLVEVQGGQMQLFIDGDLFKVVLVF